MIPIWFRNMKQPYPIVITMKYEDYMIIGTSFWKNQKLDFFDSKIRKLGFLIRIYLQTRSMKTPIKNQYQKCLGDLRVRYTSGYVESIRYHSNVITMKYRFLITILSTCRWSQTVSIITQNMVKIPSIFLNLTQRR